MGFFILFFFSSLKLKIWTCLLPRTCYHCQISSILAVHVTMLNERKASSVTFDGVISPWNSAFHLAWV